MIMILSLKFLFWISNYPIFTEIPSNAEFQKIISFIFLLKNIRDFRLSLDLANAPKFTILALFCYFLLLRITNKIN